MKKEIYRYSVLAGINKGKRKDGTNREQTEKKEKNNIAFLEVLLVCSQNQKCHSGEEPMHIIIIKASNKPKKDINLQYILMCVYILKKKTTSTKYSE